MGKHKKGSKAGGRRGGAGKKQYSKTKRGQALARARRSKMKGVCNRKGASKREAALAKKRASMAILRARKRNMWARHLRSTGKSYALIKAAWNSKDRKMAAVAQFKALQRNEPRKSRERLLLGKLRLHFVAVQCACLCTRWLLMCIWASSSRVVNSRVL